LLTKLKLFKIQTVKLVHFRIRQDLVAQKIGQRTVSFYLVLKNSFTYYPNFAAILG